MQLSNGVLFQGTVVPRKPSSSRLRAIKFFVSSAYTNKLLQQNKQVSEQKLLHIRTSQLLMHKFAYILIAVVANMYF